MEEYEDSVTGTTLEEQSKLKPALRGIQSRTKELMRSIEALERQRVAAPGQWLDSTEKVARQFRSLGDAITSSLDHWVFLPTESTDRLPDLLRTKLEADQEKREQDLAKALPASVGETDELQQRQVRVNQACGKLLSVIKESKDLQAINTRARGFATSRVATSGSGNAVKQQKLVADGTKLFALLHHKPLPAANSGSSSSGGGGATGASSPPPVTAEMDVWF